jgi:hypothetical protein
MISGEATMKGYREIVNALWDLEASKQSKELKIRTTLGIHGSEVGPSVEILYNRKRKFKKHIFITNWA